MNSITTGIILRNLRKKAQLSPKTVSLVLKNKYSIELSSQMLLDYEYGYGLPDIDCFLALCMTYSCDDILYTFGYKRKRSSFTPLSSDEEEIIQKYRALQSNDKNIILGALDIKKDGLRQEILSADDKKTLFLWILQKHSTFRTQCPKGGRITPNSSKQIFSEYCFSKLHML